VLSPTARSVHAQAQLREVLTTMSARLVGDTSVVPLPGRGMDAAEIVANPELATSLRSTLAAIADAIRAPR
jgi:hypothetical protein